GAVRVEPGEVPLLLLAMRVADLQPGRRDVADGIDSRRDARRGPRHAAVDAPARRLQGGVGRHPRRAAADGRWPDPRLTCRVGVGREGRTAVLRATAVPRRAKPARHAGYARGAGVMAMPSAM